MSERMETEPVVFHDFEDAESLSSSHTDHTEGSSYIRVRVGKRRNIIAPLLVADPSVVRSAELECKRVLKGSSELSMMDLRNGYLTLGQLAWEKGHYKAAVVWYSQAGSIVKELFGSDHEEFEQVTRFVSALEKGYTRGEYFDEICEEDRIELEKVVQAANVNSLELFDTVYTISEIMTESGMNGELELFFGDLVAGNFGKITKPQLNSEILVLFSRHHARMGNYTVAIGQAKEALHYARNKGKKSPQVAWIGLQLCTFYMDQGDMKHLLSTFNSVLDAIKKNTPGAMSTVNYIVTVAKSELEVEEKQSQLEMLFASLHRNIASLVHPVEVQDSFDEQVSRCASLVLVGMMSQAELLDPITFGASQPVAEDESETSATAAGATTGGSSARGSRRASRLSFGRRNGWFRRSTAPGAKLPSRNDTLMAQLARFLAKSFAKAVLHWMPTTTQFPVKKLATLLAVHDLTRIWQPSSMVHEPSPSQSSISLSGSRTSRADGGMLVPSFAGRSNRSLGDGSRNHGTAKESGSRSGIQESGSRRGIQGAGSESSLGKLSKKDSSRKKHRKHKKKKKKKKERRRSSGVSSHESTADTIPEEDEQVGDTEGHNARENKTPRTFKDVLVQFYQQYAPDKAGDVDSIIFQFLGRESALIHTLELKYNVRYEQKLGQFIPVDKKQNMPLDFTLMDEGLSYKSILQKFFTMFSPKRVGQVDEMLHEFSGRESELIYTLEERYGVQFHNDGSFTKRRKEASDKDRSTASTAPKLEKVRFHPSLLPKSRSFEEVLETFYSQHCPDKVQDVPSIVAEFKGREATLIHTLQLKYNVRFRKDGIAIAKKKPGLAGIDAKRHRWKRVLVAFYTEYAPEKLPEIDTILARFRGKELLLLNTLRAKYNVDVLAGFGRARHHSRGSSDSSLPAQETVAGRSLAAVSESLDEERTAMESLREDDELQSLAEEQIVGRKGLDLRTKLRNSIEAFYQVYYPEKIAHAEAIMDRFYGREAALLEILEVKYGIRIGEDGVPLVTGENKLSSFDEQDIVRESPGGGMVELKTG